MATAPIIEVTPLAAEKLGDIMKEEGQEGSLLRVMVMPGGHGGFQYMLGVEEEPKNDDVVIDTLSIKFLVDAESVSLVDGAQIDYVDGMMRSGFVISNPNMVGGGGGCGCGGHGGGDGCACGGGGHGGGGCACGGHGGGGGGGGCACGGH